MFRGTGAPAHRCQSGDRGAALRAIPNSPALSGSRRRVDQFAVGTQRAASRTTWDPEDRPLPSRPIPGQVGGEYVPHRTRAHAARAKVAYDPDSANQTRLRLQCAAVRLATLRKARCARLKIYGDEEGDLLIVGWGSTLGAIDRGGRSRCAPTDYKVSAIHLRFLVATRTRDSTEMFARFRRK